MRIVLKLDKDTAESHVKALSRMQKAASTDCAGNLTIAVEFDVKAFREMTETMVNIRQICGDQRVTREIDSKELMYLQAIVNKLAALLKGLGKLEKLEAAARADPKIASILKGRTVEKVIIFQTR